MSLAENKSEPRTRSASMFRQVHSASLRIFHLGRIFSLAQHIRRGRKGKWNEVSLNDGCCWILSSMLMRRIGRNFYGGFIASAQFAGACSGEKKLCCSPIDRDLFQTIVKLCNRISLSPRSKLACWSKRKGQESLFSEHFVAIGARASPKMLQLCTIRSASS